MREQIPLFKISWDAEDIKNVVDSISRGSHWAKGPFVDRFESELSAYFGVDHAVTVNSGTTALVAALNASGIEPDNEVIVPSFTFIATANAVRLVGAEPVFADIESKTYGLDPDSVREQITDRTAGIIPVHLYGNPCHIQELVEIAEENDLVVIEDAAEAFGATDDDAYVGTLGDAGVLSFCQNKILSTGEGGAVITDDEELAADIRLYRSHGRVAGDYFGSVGSGEYVTLGTNIRMSDLSAALGCAQLQKIEQLIEGRRSAANAMNERLAGTEGIVVPRPSETGTHVYQLYTIRLGHQVNRQNVIKTLDERGISSKIYWDTPIHQTAYYQNSYKKETSFLTETNALAENVISLPIFPDITPAEVEKIIHATLFGVEQGR